MDSTQAKSRWALPAPEPYQGPQRCPSCVGTKVTGVQYTMDTGGDQVLLVDVICPACGGCGRHQHVDCDRAEHADWPEFELDGGELYDEQDDVCPSCHGRRWWVCNGFTETEVYDMRVACGCAQELLVEVTDE